MHPLRRPSTAEEGGSFRETGPGVHSTDLKGEKVGNLLIDFDKPEGNCRETTYLFEVMFYGEVPSQ